MRIIASKSPAQELQELLEKNGQCCPTCGRKGQVRHRKFNAGMAYSLIRMYKIGGLGWVTTEEMGRISREEDKIAYWGLVEVMPREKRQREDGGRKPGVWRVTKRGEMFIWREIEIPSHAWTFDRHCLGLDDANLIGIDHALGERFDWSELMADVPRELKVVS